MTHLSKQAREGRFLDAIEAIRTPRFIERLDERRVAGKKDLDRRDWIWTALVQSQATLGRVPNMVVLNSLKSQWRWSSIEHLQTTACGERLREAFKSAGIRWPAKKVDRLVSNRQRLIESGGPNEFRKMWLSCTSLETALAHLRPFEGVGEKYARNIGMDVADPRFEQCIAVDSRIEALAEWLDPQLGKGPRRYLRIETYLLTLAKRAGVTGWHLDRTMFNAAPLVWFYVE